MNRLAKESSPYLLQHKNNPVDWFPWGEEALSKAKKENKLVLVSIGYSACHWCHVMEHEAFEDESIAAYMNQNFVNIKVDREERPDIDQIYMHAVQLMTQRGGWPLNCFVLPNGKPFYGGTYFPKDQWLHILKQLVHIQQTTPEKLTEYAEKLTEGIKVAEHINSVEMESFQLNYLKETMDNWSHQFDWQEGGMNRAPKFPMPTNYSFIQNYLGSQKDEKLLVFLELTLKKMARGGIYDQLGGGFCRYSVDGLWKVPHFEKMLYDNGQLLSLYAKAYHRTKDLEYLQVITEITHFLNRDLMDHKGGFYSALDADSEGIEGKFYVWTKQELKSHLSEKDYLLTSNYYNINEKGLWEHENYIFLRTEYQQSDQISKIQKILLEVRDQRIKPGLDDKILTSWNAITISGFADAYWATQNIDYLKSAIKCAHFLRQQLGKNEFGLFHSFQKGHSKINGFLEDYAFTSSAFIRLFEVTSDESYLMYANGLIQYAIDHFFDKENGLFNFTDKQSEQLIATKQEISDNVIPSSNSEMAHVLLSCGNYTANPDFISMAKQMLSNLWSFIKDHPSAYSNWGQLGLKLCTAHKEIVVAGPKAKDYIELLKPIITGSTVLLHCSKESELSIFKEKHHASETRIFVCNNGACSAPVSTIDEAIKLI